MDGFHRSLQDMGTVKVEAACDGRCFGPRPPFQVLPSNPAPNGITPGTIPSGEMQPTMKINAQFYSSTNTWTFGNQILGLMESNESGNAEMAVAVPGRKPVLYNVDMSHKDQGIIVIIGLGQIVTSGDGVSTLRISGEYDRALTAGSSMASKNLTDTLIKSGAMYGAPMASTNQIH